jgi:hypothetical protein
MRALGLTALIGLAGLCCLPAEAEEINWWPAVVSQTSPGGATGGVHVDSWQGGGPLFFGRTGADGYQAGGFRPFYVFWNDPAAGTAETDYLYPLLTRREDAAGRRWSLFDLVNVAGPKDPHAAGVRSFDVWPVYFSRDTGDPATSYHAVFPLHGTMQDRLGYDRLSWTLFPLYGRFERRGVVTTATPWPFVRSIEGGGYRGFALWPLFGWKEKPQVEHDRYYLWPLIYKNEKNLSHPKPDVSLGVLPFYARDERAGSISETYVWPFFGYTHRRTPNRYDETRLLWPLFVQGHGDDRLVNRWAPFYTHSNFRGDDKHWVLWPLFRQERWTDAGLQQTKTQLLFFLYWSLRQQSVAHPAWPEAQKTHLWPLFSYWDNGAGRRQFQLLSPLEVFFPYNEPVRQSYSPLFALYRYDRPAPGRVRWSLLWDAITWRRTPDSRAFHLGPLLGIEKGPEGGRIALGAGLVGLKCAPGTHRWKPFLFDFSTKPHKKAQPSGPP